MYAVIQSFEKDNTQKEAVLRLIEAEEIHKYLTPNTDIEFSDSKTFGFIHLFDTKEEAEKCFE